MSYEIQHIRNNKAIKHNWTFRLCLAIESLCKDENNDLIDKGKHKIQHNYKLYLNKEMTGNHIKLLKNDIVTLRYL